MNIGTLILVAAVSLGATYTGCKLLHANEQRETDAQYQTEWDAVKEECDGTPGGRNLRERTVKVVCADGTEYNVPTEVFFNQKSE